jgi:hypothetical protein
MLNAWFERRRAAHAPASLLLVLAAPVDAAALEDFGATTWARWQKESPRPAIVVFSTTYTPPPQENRR